MLSSTYMWEHASTVSVQMKQIRIGKQAGRAESNEKENACLKSQQSLLTPTKRVVSTRNIFKAVIKIEYGIMGFQTHYLTEKMGDLPASVDPGGPWARLHPPHGLLDPMPISGPHRFSTFHVAGQTHMVSLPFVFSFKTGFSNGFLNRFFKVSLILLCSGHTILWSLLLHNP